MGWRPVRHRRSDRHSPRPSVPKFCAELLEGRTTLFSQLLMVVSDGEAALLGVRRNWLTRIVVPGCDGCWQGFN